MGGTWEVAVLYIRVTVCQVKTFFKALVCLNVCLSDSLPSTDVLNEALMFL